MDGVTNPEWPAHLDFDLVGRGEDTRNVIDYYKYWTTEAINTSLDGRRLPYAVLVENIAHDFNIGSVVRNANAFLAAEVIIAGRRDWDRRGAVGAQAYQRVTRVQRTAEAVARYRAEGHRVVAVDNLDGAQSVFDYDFPERSLFLFGQESIGLSPEALAAADDLIYIPQLGATRSLNVGVASGIVMSFYCSQHAKSPA